MIIVLHHEALLEPDAQLALAVLVWVAFRRDHILLSDPIYTGNAKDPVEHWLGPLPPVMADTARLMLEEGPVLAATIPTRTTVVVRQKEHPPSLTWPHLQLPYSRAAAFVLRPLGILVEDRRSDRAFLRAAAPTRWRVALDRAVEVGAAEFLNGGGLGNMMHRVREHIDAEMAARLWVLFDSDAEVAGAPSANSERLRVLCDERRAHGLGYHQLICRAIENYLPVELLKTWSAFVGGDAPSRVDNIAALGQGERNHIPLKKILSNKLVSDILIDRQLTIDESWLRRNGHEDEIRGLVESIVAHI